MKKKIVFLTGTRADFGKLKSLMYISQNSTEFDVHVFVTGMHMDKVYGLTVNEVEKSGFENIYKFINHGSIEYMDRTLAKTIDGFSQFIAQIEPDLIVVHGDRVEALAGAIVGSLNNILVAHIEGGELSGTIDELIRHSVSKMSHIHLVANQEAKKRLIQLGEYEKSIFIIGSPDLDLMNEENLPSIDKVKSYYDIPFSSFAIAMFHPVTTEYEFVEKNAKEYISSLVKSNKKYIIVYPNNDLGSKEILKEIKSLEGNKNFRIFPSLRFEFFLRLLKEADFIIGNSSAGIREAPFYGVPTIDIGSRQKNRASLKSIINTDYKSNSILKAIEKVEEEIKKNSSSSTDNAKHFGNGRSDILFLKLLMSEKFWCIDHQKQMQEIY